MSLPPAPQEVSEHPHAGTVTAPVDKGAQAADVDRKLKLYGVIEAFRQGRMPDNDQIDKALTSFINAPPVDADKLSPEGKKLVQDSRDIAATARHIVKQKNNGELFQNFVWHTRSVDVERADVTTAESSTEAERRRLADDSRVAVQHLRTLLSLILTNSEVRKLLSDFSVIGRDLLAKAASKAAETLRPSDEAIAHVNEPAAEGEFITKGGKKVGTSETPVLEVDIPHTDVHVEQHPRANEPVIKTSETETTGGEVIGETQQAVRSGQALAIEKGEQVTQQEDETNGASAASSESLSEEVKGKRRDLKGHLQDAKDKIAEHLSHHDDQKSRAAEHIEQGKQFLTGEYFPPERRDQFIYRGKKVIVECQKHDDYQDAIKWLLTVAEEYAEFGHRAEEKGKESGVKIIHDPVLQQTASELRLLLERFANGQSMHLIFDSISALNDDAHRDEEFRAWFMRLNAFIRKLLLEPGYVLEDNCTREGHDIRESGRRFWDQKYRTHFDNVFHSIGDWFSAMADDPLNKRFGEDWARLTRDLLFDDNGSLTFKPRLWSDIRSVILPTLVDEIGYLPIPRIEYSNDTLDLVLENLTLQGRNLFPNIITLVAHNYFKFSPYNSISDEHHHEFTFTFAQVQADMRDVAFFFRRKTGFPKVTDSGMADVVIGGTGLTSVVHLVSAGQDRSSVFKVKNVHVKIDSLKFSIRDSKHDFLYKTLATRLVKRQIKRAIAGAIKTGMEYVDGQLVSVRDRMEEARLNDDMSRTEVLQELFKRHKDEHSIRTSESKSQFKLVSSKRASVVDTGHPSGWVKRVSESEEKAITGKDWRSEAFTIV